MSVEEYIKQKTDKTIKINSKVIVQKRTYFDRRK